MRTLCAVKQAAPEGEILLYSSDMRSPELITHTETERRRLVARGWGRDDGDLVGTEVPSGKMKKLGA